MFANTLVANMVTKWNLHLQDYVQLLERKKEKGNKRPLFWNALYFYAKRETVLYEYFRSAMLDLLNQRSV